MVIYADSMFAVNVIVNYLVLLASDKLCALNTGRWRLAAGAAVGGVYSVLALFIPFFHQTVVKLTAGIFMTMAAFGGERRLLRITITVFALSATFAGVVYGLTLLAGGMSLRTTVFALGICYFILSIAFRRLTRTSCDTARVTVALGGREASFTALIDTGNSLTDPITGAPVIIADCGAVSCLFPGCAETLLLPPDEAVEKLGECGYSFRLIPYSAVGVSGGLLAAFRPDSVTLNGRAKKSCLVALSPNPVGDGGAYSALIGAGNY